LHFDADLLYVKRLDSRLIFMIRPSSQYERKLERRHYEDDKARRAEVRRLVAARKALEPPRSTARPAARGVSEVDPARHVLEPPRSAPPSRRGVSKEDPVPTVPQMPGCAEDRYSEPARETLEEPRSAAPPSMRGGFEVDPVPAVPQLPGCGEEDGHSKPSRKTLEEPRSTALPSTRGGFEVDSVPQELPFECAEDRLAPRITAQPRRRHQFGQFPKELHPLQGLWEDQFPKRNGEARTYVVHGDQCQTSHDGKRHRLQVYCGEVYWGQWSTFRLEWEERGTRLKWLSSRGGRNWFWRRRRQASGSEVTVPAEPHRSVPVDSFRDEAPGSLPSESVVKMPDSEAQFPSSTCARQEDFSEAICAFDATPYGGGYLTLQKGDVLETFGDVEDGWAFGCLVARGGVALTISTHGWYPVSHSEPYDANFSFRLPNDGLEFAE